MNSRLWTTLAGAVVATGVVVSPAAAAQPEVILDELVDEVTVLSGDDSPCGFDVTLHDEFTVKITGFFDRDGNLLKGRQHAHGTATASTEHGEWVDRWAYNEYFDPESFTATLHGNVYNIHAGAGGVLLNDSGRLVIDQATGEALEINGPHEGWPYGDWTGDWDAACAALAPPSS